MTVAVAAASVLGSASAADAGQRHKRHHHQHSYGMWSAPVAKRVVPQAGPRWSGPNQCWTDEGYGRYSPCNGRR
jgi:hypothetical protein